MEDRKNRLAHESSPYLLQHQHNPVDWYPWGEEAFETARRENKPIFLSVGYSTCYWCHVMERQSFEIEATAAEMNARFVNIKVDREERPDVDQLYMTAVQVLTRQGGWPMSVFLTPDLRPFYGGTYFPPVDSYGRPGFVTLLKGIEDAYRNRPADVEKSAAQLVNIFSQLAEPSRPEQPLRIDDAFIGNLIDRSVADYDPRNGGFGGGAQFPRETLLELLLVHQRHHPDPGRMKMLTHTLDVLERGGIRDHLGGGFHRYSTDAHWLVPHFEIMLYDNAMLAWVYTEAFAQTREPRYANVARGILDFTLREMTDSSGAFYTAFDAEVDAREGLSYLWTPEEIQAILGPDNAKLFNAVYGVDQGPNFADPHHGNGQPDKSILYLPKPLEAAAKSAGYTTEQLESRLAPMRQSLYQARLKREQPLLDTKVLTSWNALMIRAMAYAGKVLREPRYADAATKAADFLLTHHRTPGGGLYRTSRDGRAKYDAFLDDYAFLAQALLEIGRRDDAKAQCDQMLKRFADTRSTGGGFYFTQAGARDFIIRQKTATDSPLPSGNGVAAMVLLELGQAPAARATLEAFAQQIDNNGEGMSSLVQAALQYVRAHGPIDVAPGAPSPTDRPMSPQQLAHAVVSLGAAMASPTEMHVQVNILKGFHINSHDPAPGLIATDLTVNGVDVESIDYPAGVKRKFDFAPESLHVYEGQVVIVLRLKHEPQGAFQLSLSYQPCDESSCLAPVKKTVEIAVT